MQLDAIYKTEVVTANVIGAIILLCILTNLISKPGKLEFRQFVGMVVVNLIQTILEPITILLDGKAFPGAMTVLMLTNSILFCGAIVLSCSWMLYCYTRAFGEAKVFRNVLHHVMLCSPVVIVLIGIVVNLFTPIFFYIDPVTLRYERCWGFMAIYGLTYAYLGAGLIMSYWMGDQKRYLLGSAVRYLLPVFVGSLMQFFVYGISTLWIGAAIGNLAVYLNIQNEQSFLDPLSELFNRQYLNQYLADRVRQKSRFAGFMLDVDGFKEINDRYGHLVGDQAIETCGRILRDCVYRGDVAARFAGDEFIIISDIRNETEASLILERIEKFTQMYNETNALPCPLNFSVGYAFYKPGDTLEAFFDRMDMEMYKQKQLHKHCR